MTLRLLPGARLPTARVVILRAVATPLNLRRALRAPSRLIQTVLLEDGARLAPLRVRTDHAWHDDHATLRQPGCQLPRPPSRNRYSRNTERFFVTGTLGAVMVIPPLRFGAGGLGAGPDRLAGRRDRGGGRREARPHPGHHDLFRERRPGQRRGRVRVLGQNVSVQQPPGVARLRRRGERARGRDDQERYPHLARLAESWSLPASAPSAAAKTREKPQKPWRNQW